MFCSGCGMQLAEDALFCPHCGKKVKPIHEVSGQGDSLGDVNHEMAEAGYGEEPHLHTSRMNTRARSVSMPAGEKAANRQLFELYSRLITPVKAIEILEQKVQANNNTMLMARCRRSEFGSNLFVDICVWLVLWLVLMITLPYSAETGFEPTSASEIFILWWPFRQHIVANGQRPMLLWFIQPVLIIVVVSVIMRILINFVYKRDARKICGELTKENAAYKNQQQQIIDAIAPYIGYVPPDYRTSERLTFFVRDYNNCKVDNLKEAVRLCDEEEFRMEVVSQLKEVNYNLQTISAELAEISGSLHRMEGEAAFIAANTLATSIVAGTALL